MQKSDPSFDTVLIFVMGGSDVKREMIDPEMEAEFARERKRPAPLTPEEDRAAAAFARVFAETHHYNPATSIESPTYDDDEDEDEEDDSTKTRETAESYWDKVFGRYELDTRRALRQQRESLKLKRLSEIYGNRAPIRPVDVGHWLVDKLRRSLARFDTDGCYRSPGQTELHESFIASIARLLYGDCFTENVKEILDRNRWKEHEVNQWQSVETPRRWGKSESMGQFLAAVFYTIPGVNIALFAPSFEQAKALLNITRKYIEMKFPYLPIVGNSSRYITARFNARDRRRLVAYPSTVNVSCLFGVIPHPTCSIDISRARTQKQKQKQHVGILVVRLDSRRLLHLGRDVCESRRHDRFHDCRPIYQHRVVLLRVRRRD